MSDSTSSSIMDRLRREAASLGRPEQRVATLERLVEACNAIADGSARAIVKKGNPRAEINFTGKQVRINPPRIEEYVIARRELDRRSNIERSLWTGPVASSLRKEGAAMLAYVRARDLELNQKKGQSSAHGTAAQEWWRLVDDVPDESVRLRLVRELSEGIDAKKAVVALKAAVRMCSANFDIDAYLRGEGQRTAPLLQVPQLAPALAETAVKVLVTLVNRLTSNDELAGFDLEFDGQRVRQRSTKARLVEANELQALQRLTESGIQP